MELSEALRTIDATKGMFDFFLCEVKFGDLKEKFLQTPIKLSAEDCYDAKKQDHDIEHKEYYTFFDNGIERKGYIVDIHPVCNYLINEWPSSKARKIRRILRETFSFCFDDCKDILGEDIAPALEEGYVYDKLYMEIPEPRTIQTVIFDTIHEMIHALGLTEYEILAENSKSVESKDTEGEVPYGDNLLSTEKQIKTAVKIMRQEKVIKHLYDYAYLMKVMNETEDMPNFNSPKSFLDYITDLGITNLPSEDSIKKKVNATFGNHPSWTFTDKKGIDANEARRRNAVGSRFLSIYRKAK